MQGFIDVAGGRVLAIEDGKVLHLMTFAPVLSAETQHGLAKIHDAIVGRCAGTAQIDTREFRVLFEQHGNCAGALRWFTTAAARIFGDISADNDSLTSCAVEREVPERTFHAIDAAQAGMFELRDFTATGNRCYALLDQCAIDHPFDNDRARGIIRAGFGAKAQKLDA